MTEGEQAEGETSAPHDEPVGGHAAAPAAVPSKTKLNHRVQLVFKLPRFERPKFLAKLRFGKRERKRLIVVAVVLVGCAAVYVVGRPLLGRVHLGALPFLPKPSVVAAQPQGKPTPVPRPTPTASPLVLPSTAPNVDPYADTSIVGPLALRLAKVNQMAGKRIVTDAEYHDSNDGDRYYIGVVTSCDALNAIWNIKSGALMAKVEGPLKLKDDFDIFTFAERDQNGQWGIVSCDGTE